MRQWLDEQLERFAEAFYAIKGRLAAAFKAREVVEAAEFAVVGAVAAVAYTSCAGYTAVGMLGAGFGVGAAVGPVALVLGAVMGLAAFGLRSLRRTARVHLV